MRKLTIDCSSNGALVKVILNGQFTQLDAINLKTELPSKIKLEKKMIVDLTKVSDFDLTGINTLLRTKLMLSLKDVLMTIKVDNNEVIKKLLKLTNIDKEFVYE